MTSLSMNLVKRVERLPKPSGASEAMQPLFEAISNSIHSTQEKYKDRVVSKGRIYVEVTTDRAKSNVGATVADNGVGLDKKHYEAFTTTDTDDKIAIGGKGVGRLLWLDCFEKIHIDSIYKENGQLHRRSFDFELAIADQIKNHKTTTKGLEGSETGMTVTFEGLRSNGYLDRFPGRATFVLQHFMSHFLPTFIGGKSPLVSLTCGGETKEFPEAINEIIHRRASVESQTDSYGKLDIALLECDKTASADLDGRHFVHFIAHDRTVISQSIDAKLGLKNFGEASDRVFHACVFGDFLNKNVNQERTRFTFEDGTIEAIVNDICMPHIEKFLAEPMAEQREKQAAVIEDIVATYPSVQFGPTEELQEYIPSGELAEDAIYSHLARQRFRRDQKQTEKINEALYRLKGDGLDPETLKQTIFDASQAIEDAEQRSLAEYIVRRKVVLEFLGLLLEKVRNDSKDSAYQTENVLHTFICPMQVATVGRRKGLIEPASHDLWVVDERLTFANYFSSDVAFDDLAVEFQSKDRPDLAIFDHVHGLREADDSSKILLIEFKRPGRKSYEDHENPQLQVERYIRKLQSGNQMDVAGRPISFNQNTVFYCYIVADCVGAMNEWTYSWGRTADGRGRVYQPSNGFKGTIELVGWDTLLDDANARNRAFFERAGIAQKNFFSEE
jgi:hypothetical protein